MSNNTTTSTFSAQTLIGMAKEAAIAAVEAAGFSFRVICEDGAENMRTMDINNQRVNFSISKGVVEKVDLG